jgi:hypothetical protein
MIYAPVASDEVCFSPLRRCFPWQGDEKNMKSPDKLQTETMSTSMLIDVLEDTTYAPKSNEFVETISDGQSDLLLFVKLQHHDR